MIGRGAAASADDLDAQGQQLGTLFGHEFRGLQIEGTPLLNHRLPGIGLNGDG